MEANQANQRGYSLVQDSGAYSSSCGYCNGDEGGSSHGMHAYRLTVYDYQELLDQGWRRSGKYLYKPDNKVTCCRQYTIRLKVGDFQPSKAHKRLMRKWEQFLAGHLQQEQQQADAQGDTHMADSTEQEQQQQRGSKRSRNSSNTGQPAADGAAGTAHAGSGAGAQEAAAAATASSASKQQQQHLGGGSVGLVSEVTALLQQAVLALSQAGQLPQQGLPEVRVVVPPAQKLSKLPAGTTMTSSSAHALAAAARKWQQQQQQQPAGAAANGAFWCSVDDLGQALADRFNALAAAVVPAVVVTASAAKGHINFAGPQVEQQSGVGPQGQGSRQQQQAPGKQLAQQQNQSGQQQQQQQAPGQQAAQQHQQSAQQQQQQPAQQQQQQQRHCLEIRMVPNQFIQEEYELYCKYQMQQHQDDPEELTPNRYKNFLVDTPLIPVAPPSPAAAAAAGGGGGGAAAAGVPVCGYGSFHQQYWLDGKLVAVGVVDVLPRCLSSKYFFWDPAYAWLSLGRYGALQEINWVAGAHAGGASQLQYYYLGYYIHTCPKMAYKAEYAPSELLCPQRQVWVRIDQVVTQALDRAPYVVLSDLPGVQMQPNLSVPRPLPAPAGAGGGGGGSGHAAADGAAGGGGAMPHRLGLHAQMQARQQARQQLDAQLLFLLKQPVRWGALRDSGMLADQQISAMEERLAAWRAVVGETASHLLYAAPNDLLSVG